MAVAAVALSGTAAGLIEDREAGDLITKMTRGRAVVVGKTIRRVRRQPPAGRLRMGRV